MINQEPETRTRSMKTETLKISKFLVYRNGNQQELIKSRKWKKPLTIDSHIHPSETYLSGARILKLKLKLVHYLPQMFKIQKTLGLSWAKL